MPISVESKAILNEIKEKRWWQGSLISGKDLHFFDKADNPPDWWVIASQTCNLYNSSFDNVPLFELVAAKQIEKCNNSYSRGDHPRILHVVAQYSEETISLELNIQNRKWCKREILSELPKPTLALKDAGEDSEQNSNKNQWLDKFIGWMSRSYNRVTLPDEFNEAIRQSKIEDVFKKKLTKNKDELYGIYLALHSDADTSYRGSIGEMPPPYQLSIILVVHEEVNPLPLRTKLLNQLFSDSIADPEDRNKRITRSQLARRHHIRLLEDDIEVKSVAEFSLAELKAVIRYSLVDHLSDSSLDIP